MEDLFKNVKTGGVLGALVLGGGAFLLGGGSFLVAGIAALAGLFLGNQTLGDIKISGLDGYYSPSRIAATAKPVETGTLSLKNGDKNYSVTLPVIGALQHPWQNVDNYIETIMDDTKRLLRQPMTHERSGKLLHDRTEEKNTEFYSYLATVEQYSTQETPPSFPQKPVFQLPRALEEEYRVYKGVSKPAWDKMTQVSKLQEIENSLNERCKMLAKDTKVCAEKITQIKGANASLFNFGQNIKHYIPFTDTHDEQIHKTVTAFVEGNMGEEKFKQEMEYLVQRVQPSNEKYADAIREWTELAIENNQLRDHMATITDTKKNWAKTANKWVDAMEMFQATHQPSAAQNTTPSMEYDAQDIERPNVPLQSASAQRTGPNQPAVRR